MAKAITIPQELAKEGDLVLIPRKEYEAFSEWQKRWRLIKNFRPSLVLKREIKEAREDYKRGRYFSLDELEHKLDSKN